MTQQQLFIPSKIKVGFQNRDDTYTKKLAYVVYYDLKGVLRKEASWNSWRDTSIEPLEFENVPTSGFVLNKGVGGARQSYGWNTRNEYIRVYDPRDFEFEISVANLLFILRECDCNKGKGLEGKFVYAWDGKDLVLLPESASEYQKSKDYTNLQDKGVPVKQLVFGAKYLTKKQEPLVYLGKFDYYTWDNEWAKEPKFISQKRHIFVDENNKFIATKDSKKLATRIGEDIDPNYSYLVESYIKSIYGSKIVKVFTEQILKLPEVQHTWREYWTVELDNRYYLCHSYSHCDSHENDFIVDANGTVTRIHAYSYDRSKERKEGLCKVRGQFYPPNRIRTIAELESGSQFIMNGMDFIPWEKKNG